MPRPLEARLHQVSRRLVVGSVAAAMVAGLAGVAVPAAPAAAADSALLLTASETTFTSSAEPSRTHDQLSYLSATRTTDKTYLKFDTSSVPVGARVVSAALELDVVSTRATGGYVQVYDSATNWSASTLVETNRPAGTTEVQSARVQAAVGKVVVPLGSGGSAVRTPTAAFQLRYSVSGAATKLSKSARLRIVVASSVGATPPALTPAPTSRPFVVPGPNTTGKKVFAHYFPPYPISLDNQPTATDYYSRNYLEPGGEGGKFLAYGGLLRDRPRGRSPLSGDWRLQDLQTEVRQAAAAGIDGFTVDILGTSGRNWETTMLLMKAAATSGVNFTVVPNLDANGTGAAAPPSVVADKLAQLYASSAAYRLPDGRYVLSSFKAEGKSVSWWSEVIQVLDRSYGIRIAFIAVLLNSSDSNMTAFAPISYALSNWGTRTAQVAAAGANNVAKARALGVKWMAPVAVQDARPAQGKYAESGNTEALRATWRRAIDDGADLVQMVTWNDYSETTSFAPSLHHGESFLDISAFYLTQFKSGAVPRLTGDAIYLVHRKQPWAASAAVGTQVMSPTLGGARTPPRDTVEVIAMSRAPARVTVRVGGASREVEVPAGLSAVVVPLAEGSVTAQLARDGVVVSAASSPFAVSSTPRTLDLQYVAVSSTGR